MVGSRQYFRYTTDAAVDFVISMDESNALAVGAALNPYVGTVAIYGIPSNITPRYARYVTASGKRSRNIPICDDTVLSSALPNTLTTIGADDGEVTPVEENTFKLQALVGELFRVQTSDPDTGLTDGTNP